MRAMMNELDCSKLIMARDGNEPAPLIRRLDVLRTTPRSNAALERTRPHRLGKGET
jgi:hypothetical protein